ncbi:Protein lin-54, partial [Fasciolopsis buskii]
AVSPGSAIRCATVLPIRPSPAKGAHRANFLPILPKFRSRRLPKSRALRQSKRKRSPTPTDAEVREKVMAILERMKEIEAKQRKEKEEAIIARIGGIKNASKASRATSNKLPSESPAAQEVIPDPTEEVKCPRLEPISPASSAGETTSSLLMDGSGTREEPVLKSLRCLPACPSPFPEEQQPVDRTPSPCVGQISFAPNNLDTNFQTQSLENTSSVLSNGIMVRRCTCSRTGCLKLYCDCFAAGQRCSDCCCFGCRNNSEHEELRQKAIDRIMTRKPDAFLSKIEYSSANESVHTRGCNCKRSSCVKNYCECYEARIRCTSRCRCQSCYNTESWVAQTPPGNQSKPGMRPRSGSSHTSCSADQLVVTAGCSSQENFGGSVTVALTTGAVDDGRASASSPSTTTNDLDALSAMLVDRPDSPGTTEDGTALSMDGQFSRDPMGTKLNTDERVAPATVSVGSSGASRPSTPLSSNSSVVPSPSMEVRSLGQQPIISSQLVQPTIQSAPTSNSVMTATVIPQVTPAPTPLDRIWQTVSQVAGHSDPIPLPNPLVGLQLPTVPGAPLAGMTGLMPNSTYSSISPSTQPPTTTATTTTTTLFGIPGDAPNLLTTYLVALLSGQSQVTLPTPQPAPNFFNPATITTMPPSTILLNCPTASVPPTVLATPTVAVSVAGEADTTVPTAGENANPGISIVNSTRTNIAHPAPKFGSGISRSIDNSVIVLAKPASATTTVAAVRPISDPVKSEISATAVVTTPTEVSHLSEGDQYTAEELATFERLLQQRCKMMPKASPANDTPATRANECHQTPIKVCFLEFYSILISIL